MGYLNGIFLDLPLVLGLGAIAAGYVQDGTPLPLSLLYVSTALVAWCVLTFAANRSALRDWPCEPFPRTLPVLGNLHCAGAKFMGYIVGCAKEHGKLFLFWPGNSPMVVEADPNAARQVLGDINTFAKGPDYREKFGVVFGEGLVTSVGKKHSQGRRCLGKYFVRDSLANHMELISSEVDRLLDRMVEPRVGEVLNMEELYAELTLQVFCQVQLSWDIGAVEGGKFAKFMSHIVAFGSNVIGEHMIFGIPMWDIFPRVRRLKKAKVRGYDRLDVLVEERRAAVAKGDDVPDDCLTAMINEGFETKQITEHVVTLISAGHDTTAYFCSYMSYMLGQHPDVQDKVSAEMGKVLGKRTSVTAADIDNLTYTKTVMQETLRLYPVIPMLTRLCTKDVSLKESGKRIKEGTRVLVPFFVMNRMPDVWPEPNKFDPERFAAESKFLVPNKGFIPFGYGSRMCIGYTMAQMESYVIFSLLLKRFKFEAVEDYKPRLTAGISLTSGNGIKVRVQRR